MSLKYTVSAIGLGLVYLVAAPAFAAPSPTTPQASFDRSYQHSAEDMDVASRAIVAATTLPSGVAPKTRPMGTAEATATAEDNAVVELPSSSTFRTAADAARESAGMTTTAVCDAYFTQSQALTPTLGPAYEALGKRDLTTLGTLLPGLQAQLNGIVASEVKPEVCDGTHINAYSDYSYFETNVLRNHNIDTGLPAALPLVKQPDLLLAPLAYAVGWTLYEQKDFQSALAAYGKGLVMFPHDHTLQNEYIATLLQLGRGAQTVSYAEGVIDGTYDLSDDDRAKFFAARAVGLVMMGRLDEADASLGISLRYHYNDSVKQMRDQLRAQRAAAQK
ncbi:MAG TPA: hypothetical protein VG839_07175 [Asticcacaulis sp.]|nr:hypothetical protein [Asticcacaulis sp.]